MPQQLFNLLKKDHRQVEQMMKQILAATEEDRQELFVALKEALNEHLQIEEKHFYPKLKQIKEMKELVQDALNEHKEAKDHLLELEEMDVEASEWQNIFKTMQEGILHHVQDEEKKVFPKCTQLMEERQLTEIGEKCVQEKQKAHPARPATSRAAKTPQKKQAHV